MKRRFSNWWAMLLIAVVIAIIFLLRGSGSIPRGSAQRLVARANMKSIAQAYAGYHQNHAAIPTLAALIGRGEIPADLAAGCIEAVPPDAGLASPQSPLVAGAPLAPIRKGDPFGGPGERAERDIPAVRYVVFGDFSVKEITENVFQRDYAGLLTRVTQAGVQP